MEVSAKISDRHLLEEFIDGKEVICGVMGTNRSCTAMPVVEIVHSVSSFFDYKAKYVPGGSDEICPTRLDDTLTKKYKT